MFDCIFCIGIFGSLYILIFAIHIVSHIILSGIDIVKQTEAAYQALSSQVVDGGDAYEFLIKKFADTTNKKAGEFYTPRSVVRLMVNMLDPHEGETVYDPACGTGGMLMAAVAHVNPCNPGALPV